MQDDFLVAKIQPTVYIYSPKVVQDIFIGLVLVNDALSSIFVVER